MESENLRSQQVHKAQSSLSRRWERGRVGRGGVCGGVEDASSCKCWPELSGGDL